MATVLSPAGNIDALRCAVNNGTDAVYLGLDSFNARMKADNFTIDTLPEVVAYCHLFGVKVYVTVNTSIKQSELPEAYKLIDGIYLSCADGIIITDIALLVYCQKYKGTTLDIVASTQLNIHDLYGAQYVEKLGATTVVVARECTLDTIRDIASNTNLKVESFIHGAMCVCQSGQCLMSAIVGGNSGNRGMCAQPCRQLYTSYNGREKIVRGYMLSPKDLCGLDIAKQLEDAGVSVYKIEGRNRRAQYSGIASRVYKHLFSNGCKYTTQQLSQLKLMFNRGNYLSKQYLVGDNGDIIYRKAQGHIGLDIGQISRGKLTTNIAVTAGDAYKVMSDGIEVGNGVILAGGTGSIALSYSGDVRDGDRVCLTSSSRLIEDIDNAKRTLPVTLMVSGSVGDYIHIEAKCNNIVVSCTSDTVAMQAVNIEAIRPNLTKQLSKTGNTHYTITDIVYNIGDIYLPISAINNMRRQLLDNLSETIVAEYNNKLNRNAIASTNYPEALPASRGNSIMAVCYNMSNLTSALVDSRIDIVVYYSMHLDSTEVYKVSKLAGDKTVYFDIAPFATLSYVHNCIARYNNIGIVANNIGAVGLAQQTNIPYIVGSGMNIYNSASAKQLAADNAYIYSHELTLAEIGDISSSNGYTYVDGELTLMKTVHCPYKANGYNCNNCQDVDLSYRDTKGNTFYIVRRYQGICTFDIVNGVPLSIANRDIPSGNMAMQYDNTIVQHYTDINKGKFYAVDMSDNFTKGRLFDKTK